ncbi:MAG TPA: hypothetical protein VGS03_04790 [Candidatus Polarisedimenticolia bacterium]|nr:hypothetical protein [Candidatus Polarisedimenticolia bacterium]
MNKVSGIPARPAVAMVALAAIALALPHPADATCINPQPMQHGLGSFFMGCPDINPVQGYLFVLGQEATLNSDSTAAGAGADQQIDFVCEATGVTTEQAIDCMPEAGVAGDGNVVVAFDWGGINLSNGNACPNPAGVIGVGRNIIQVSANDGALLIATMGFSLDFGFYIVEAAGPEDLSPMACSHDNGLTLVSNTSGLESQTVCFLQSAPPVHSDCDPGTVGELLGTCQGGTGTPLTVTPGNLYTRTGPCNAPPDLRRASWTPLATTPGPGGSKCGVVNPPLDNSCLFYGASSFFGDGANPPAESPALTAWMRQTCAASAASAGAPRPGCGAAVDEVVVTKAEILKGRLHVDFSTVNEATIIGFNVYGGVSKLNSGLIAAVGQGNNDYSFEVGRGALKNERAITVEAVLSNGTTVLTAAVTVK